MPNWCEFDLKISGPASDVSGFETQLVMNLAGKDSYYSILNTFIPMPEEILDTTSPDRDPHGKDAIAKAYGAEAVRMQAENQAHQEKRERLIQEYGAGDWYSWAVNNWGVKWADRCRLVQRGARSMKLSGQTPWGPPLEGLENISERWPNLRFTIEWFECGMGFAGKAVLCDGEILSHNGREYHGGRGG